MKSAELELELKRRSDGNYDLSMQYVAVDSDVETKPLRGAPAVVSANQLKALERLNPKQAVYGTALGAAFFEDGRVWLEFEKARAATFAARALLRVRLLLDPAVAELDKVRWECLRDETGGLLFNGERVLFSRNLSSSDISTPSSDANSKLRLFCAIANPKGLESHSPNGEPLALIPAGAIRERIKVAAKSMKVSFREEVSLGTIREGLSDGCDIFYFAAHGAIVEGKGWLWLRGDKAGVIHVPAEELVQLVEGLANKPRLAILASCQSAGERVFETLGARLAEIGVPAVLAMQGSLTIDSESKFTPTLLRELRKHGSIDRAVGVARWEIRQRPDWWTPVLYMRLRSGQLVPSRTSPFLTRRVAVGAAVAAAAAVAAGIALPRGIKRIAVLPVVNGTGETQFDSRSYGLVVDLINSLSRIPGLIVTAQSTSSAFLSSKESPAKFGKSIGVDTVLAGTLRRAETMMEVVLELVNVRWASHEWGDKIQFPEASWLEGRKDIIDRPTREIVRRLSKQAEMPTPRKDTGNEKAYSLYSLGLYELNKRGVSPSAYEDALGKFQEAIREDPHYAKAHAGIADTYILMVGSNPTKGRELLPLAHIAADDALKHEPNLPEAHAALGFIRMQGDFLWKPAEKSLLRAVELNESFANAYSRLGRLYSALGRFPDAIRCADRAKAIDPKSLGIRNGAALCRYFARQFEQAAEIFEAVAVQNPKSTGTRQYLAIAWMRSGRAREAVVLLEALAKEKPADLNLRFDLSRAQSLAGDVAGARKTFASARAALSVLAPENPRSTPGPIPVDSAVSLAEAATEFGDYDLALSALEVAWKERVWSLMYLNVQPNWDKLRESPRFQELVRQLDFPKA